MRSIKHLRSAVHSSLRSSVILFDLTRVVEELIFNSLDAGAAKVSVAIRVGACFVKVEDDGSGITRDGLVLLGERYATSKLHHLAEMDAASQSFGFRGEALGSLSDISLLEIITKVHGRPSGYRKVIKGCKCLYLGIDNCRQDAGTTVIVRELFYNQPVRRKYMHSSPKKVLHSVTKCVLRIALVHPHVSFKVIDIESEDEMLCTPSSFSPLSLVMRNFGLEVSNSLHRLNFSEGALKLSGYLSAPGDSFPMKVLQCVYINSRFVCKGPIHKLLKNLAYSDKCLDLWKRETESQYGKRSKPQAYPAYILNLCCPRSTYDLTFEPSKTIVEFKDWVPVLAFVEQAIKQFWQQIPIEEDIVHAYEASGGYEKCMEDEKIALPRHDMWVKSEAVKKKRRTQYDLIDISPYSCPLNVQSEESDLIPHHKNCNTPSRKLHRNTPCFEGQNTKTGYAFPVMTPTSLSSSIPNHMPKFSPEGCSHTWTPGNNVFPSVDNLMKDELIAAELSLEYVKGSFLNSGWGNESPEADANISREFTRWLSPCNNQFKYRSSVRGVSFPSDSPKSLKIPLLGRCSLLRDVPYEGSLKLNTSREEFECSMLRNVPYEGSSYTSHEEFEVHHDRFKTKTKPSDSEEMVGVLDDDDGNQSFDFCLKASWQDRPETSQMSSGSIRKCSTTATDLDLLPRDFIKPYPSDFDKMTRVPEAEIGQQSYDIFWKSTWQDEAETSWLSSGSITKCSTTTELDVLPRDFMKPSPSDWEYLSEGSGPPNDSPLKVGEIGSNHQSINSEWCYRTSDSISWDTPWKGEHFSGDYACRKNFRTTKSAMYELSENGEGNDEYEVFGYDTMQNSPTEEGCPVVCREIFSDKLTDVVEWVGLDASRTDNTDNCTVPTRPFPSPYYNNKGNNQRDLGSQNCVQYHGHTRHSRRSHSAPPFHKGCKKFSTVYNHETTTAEPDAWIVHDATTLPGAYKFKPSSRSCAVSEQYSEGNLSDSSFFYMGTIKETMQHDKQNIHGIEKIAEIEKTNDPDSLEGLITDRLEDSELSGVKWRNSHLQATDGNEPENLHGLNDVLDVSSGILQLAGGSLVPESIEKDFLENAKILLQLDKKFIPIMAGGTLTLIDQHAADERIRLEELRHKVLSGEGKTVAYLDAEQELVLPEIGYQLVHNYAEQIKNWGWICNIHANVSGSFTKNMNLLNRQPSTVTLLAVPCILGVNLKDKDLLEFLEQLAETDGSSTMPPSVLRVLNFKACRGAIMFGDSLLPSECSLIINELKQTSLSFQCAHGRPTTAPIVNLKALHKQITELQLWNENSNGSWHGLRRHKLSLERSKQRLSSG
ncbi:DNA mismatch repair protein MLH3 isoform X2 [Telopea speciosissima]|uniref:DNA mismatch repair protein MLH3 isoform X2 n=1 Tax=Telopea speciosissima TaxID=54955 RepID=UPI001CC3EFBE|nr:DNA mismatch repair protein MLH3 isoform X2 [Telopea speciosissima]